MTRRRILSIAAAVVITVAVVLINRGGSEGGADDADPQAFCRNVERLGELVAAAATDPTEETDISAARSLASDISRTAERLQDAPPEAIAEDVRDLARVTVDLADELAAFYQEILDDPAQANDPAFLTSFEPVTEERQAEIERAGRRVRPWVEDHCGTAPRG